MIKEKLIKRFNNLWMKYKILKSKERLNNLNKEDKKAFIFLAADYRNMGDVAITYAQKMFLEDSFNDYKVIEIPADKTLDFIKPVKKIINKQDIITTIGGGNMGDLYEYYESLRREVIKNFKHNLIVSFPQTIDFSETKKGKKSLINTIKAIKNHKNLIVLAREEKSFNKMKEYFGEKKVYLMPDIVFYLKNKIGFKSIKKNKVGICFRDDKENNFSKIKLKNDVLEYLKYVETEKFNTYLPENKFKYEDRYNILNRMLEQISSYKIIYTDRLHAMIFAYLVNTQCYFIDNSNKKISGTYNLWLKDSQVINELNNVKESLTQSYENEHICESISESVLVKFNDLKTKMLERIGE